MAYQSGRRALKCRCPGCSNRVLQCGARGRVALYCSARCRSNAWYAKRRKVVGSDEKEHVKQTCLPGLEKVDVDISRRE